MIASGPALARETLDQLESSIVDVDKAAGLDQDPASAGSDATARVPGSPEPPD